MLARTSYLVTRFNEQGSNGHPFSPYIPTLGAATTAVDLYRVAGIYDTNLPDIGASFTDVSAVAAISKVAEGGISSYKELEAAEVALQALLLHEVVLVLVHGPKVDNGNGFIGYRRLDEGARTQFGFDLLKLAASQDFLMAPELLKSENGKITEASLPNSPLMNLDLSQVAPGFNYWNESIAAAINASISQHGVPAYLTDPYLIRTRRGDGFHKRFYSRLNISWKKSTEGMPPIVCTFGLPPLLAIVLDRMTNREDLAQVVSDLRDELKDVRRELREFNDILTASTDQGEIERLTERITQSFDAIFPESRLSNAEKWQRRIAVIQRLVRSIVKPMAGFFMSTGPSYEELLSRANGVSDLVLESRAVVDRTITAQTFAGLARTDALQSLVKEHFEQSEIDAIEQSIGNRF